MYFDHWDLITQNPLDTSTNANKIVETIRKRKALKPGIPPLDEFIDKM